jgi:hypothetical protein
MFFRSLIDFKNYCLILLVLAFANVSTAQKVFQPKQVNATSKGILYKTEKAFDIRLHTNGFAVAMNWGEILNYYTTRYYHLEIGHMKDQRERRRNKNLSFRGLGTSSDFVFGKQNTMFALRGGIGFKKYLSEKTRRRGIAVGYSWEVGPSVALLRPYYLDLIFNVETETGLASELRSEKFSEENRDKFLDVNNDIYGSSGFFENLNEWSFIPGIQGKFALHLSKGAFDKSVRALEVGVMADIYSKRVPIMIETDAVSNKPYFFNFYASIQFGKRAN